MINTLVSGVTIAVGLLCAGVSCLLLGFGFLLAGMHIGLQLLPVGLAVSTFALCALAVCAVIFVILARRLTRETQFNMIGAFALALLYAVVLAYPFAFFR